VTAPPREPLAPLTIVAAIANGGVIGKQGKLPFHIPEDLRHFKKTTMGHAIIMGRKTYESIGKPLSGRRNIVVSRTQGFCAPGCHDFESTCSLEEAIFLARATDHEPHVIGGSMLYDAALPLATRMHLTLVHHDYEGDTFFPTFDRSEWREVLRYRGESEGVEFMTLER
jgi:dihydrofolate reductase